MARRTKISQSPSQARIPKFQPYVGKERATKHSEFTSLELPVAWNFRRMDDGGKFKCTLQLLHDYATELIKLEGKTKNELMQRSHNHPMSIDKLSREAKARLDVLNLEVETLFQLDLKTPARLWGLFEHNIFHVIWLDKEHKVYIC